MQSAHQLHYIGCLKIDTTRVYEQTMESQVSDNLYLTYNLLDNIPQMRGNYHSTF